MRKSIFGLSLLALALIAAACGGGSLEGEEVLVLVNPTHGLNPGGVNNLNFVVVDIIIVTRWILDNTINIS